MKLAQLSEDTKATILALIIVGSIFTCGSMLLWQGFIFIKYGFFIDCDLMNLIWYKNNPDQFLKFLNSYQRIDPISDIDIIHGLEKIYDQERLWQFKKTLSGTFIDRYRGIHTIVRYLCDAHGILFIPIIGYMVLPISQVVFEFINAIPLILEGLVNGLVSIIEGCINGCKNIFLKTFAWPINKWQIFLIKHILISFAFLYLPRVLLDIDKQQFSKIKALYIFIMIISLCGWYWYYGKSMMNQNKE